MRSFSKLSRWPIGELRPCGSKGVERTYLPVTNRTAAVPHRRRVMVSRRWLWLLCGVAILASALTVSARGVTVNKTAYLTFSQAVALPNVTLRAGTYVFERADPNGSPRIVRVLSRDREIVYYTGFTNWVARPSDLRGDAVVSFGEATAGAPQPIRTWWPAGEEMGHEFIYR